MSMENPTNERKELKQISKVPEGNVFSNMRSLTLLVPSIMACSFTIHPILFVVDPFKGIVVLDQIEIILYIVLVFGAIGMIIFGILYDSMKETAICIAQGLAILGTVMCLLSQMFNMPKFMIFATTVQSLTMLSLYVIIMALVNDTFEDSKVGGVGVMYFFFSFGNIVAYALYFGFQSYWINLIVNLALLVVGLVGVLLYNRKKDDD